MSVGLGRQPLSTQKVLGSVPPPPHYLSKSILAGQARARQLCKVNNFAVARPPRRCRPGQILAFKTESSPAKKTAGPTDSLAHRSNVVRYRFIVPQYVTTFGQTLRVVGSLPELGDWNPDVAPVMTWSDGHQWSLECALPQRSFEFKITVFEGHGIKWEGGSNRVVHAEDAEGDIPVEIVVWLTCHFNATASTQLQLAVRRATIQDAYETGKATLEFLRLRKSKLGHDNDQDCTPIERRQHTAELARLLEAVAEQSTVVHQLSDWLRHEAVSSRKFNGRSDLCPVPTSADEENALLLLAIDSVKVPRTLRRLSFAQSWEAGPAALPPASGAASHGAAPVTAGPARSPFLRGELDSRAEDVMSVAELLLKELETSSDAASASLEWACLAQEAGQVAVALEALGGVVTPSDHATHLQLRGLASVGTALAGRQESAVESIVASPAGQVELEETPQPHVLERDLVEAEAVAGDGMIAESTSINIAEQLRQESGLLDGPPDPLSVVVKAPANNGDGAVSTVNDLKPLDEGEGSLTLQTTSSEPGGGTEAGAGRLTAAPNPLLTQSRAPGLHSLQKLAANVKDAPRIGVAPGAATIVIVQQTDLSAATQQASAHQVHNGLQGSSSQESQQQQEAAAAGGWRWTEFKLNLRAFLDSLFL